MSLRVNKDWWQITKWAIWSILGVLFLVFLIRVATFEASYYSEKEGSERDVAITAEPEQEELIEENRDNTGLIRQRNEKAAEG